jgi:hypothetical protein
MTIKRRKKNSRKEYVRIKSISTRERYPPQNQTQELIRYAAHTKAQRSTALLDGRRFKTGLHIHDK